MSSSSYSSPEITSATHTDPAQERFSTMYETQDDVLEDLTSRFILNLPDEELNSLERISFQVEQAHWYYEDFIREANPKFPSLPLKRFSAMLFDACPLLHRWEDHEQAFTEFMQYKTRVPVCGAIMLNDTWEKCVLVKGWKSSSGWGFPKGKINENEPRHNCAIREVLEETGYNLAGQLNPDHLVEMSIKEQKISLFIVPGVPEDYPFKTKTRKEISKIEWFRLVDLPTWKRNKAAPGKFYLITPFISSLKQFIRDHKPSSVPRKPPRAKKIRHHDQRPANRHQLSPDDSPSSSSQEANQESSSQSSSADPQTPSPQSISTLANHVGIVDTELDPHFARLLSGLTLSGTAVVTQQPIVQKSTSPSLGRASTSPAGPREPSTPIPAISPALEITPVAHTSSGRTRNSLSVLPPSPSHPTSKSLQSPLPTSASSSSTSPIRPFRGHASRRTSSTADISPYLAKLPEIPSSAKRLKQLALLEAVANESARMSPVLQMRDAAVNGVLKEHVARHSQPLPSQSVPPSSLVPHDHNVLYSSAPVGGFLPPGMQEDPFVVRPRTSQAAHRALYPGVLPSSMSMTQSQLSTLMNAPRTTPAMPTMVPGHAQFRFPPPPPPPRYLPVAAPFSRDASFPAHQFSIQQPPPVPVLTGSLHPIPLQVPMSAPALTPSFNVPPMPLPRNGNSLLSILNGNFNPTALPPPGTFHGTA